MALPNNRRIFDMAAHRWREEAEELQMQCASIGIPIATSLGGYFRQLTLYGRSALWLPQAEQPVLAQTLPASAPPGEGATYAAIRRMRALLNEGSPVIPLLPPLSGSGYYGQSCPREIPDTPLAEWTAGVEALLADCAQWQAQTEEVLHDPA